MKMKLKKMIETDQFEVKKNKKTYEITVERNNKEAWNIWINEKRNGFRMFMFGLNKELEYTEVLNIIQGNLETEIKIYEEDLEDYEKIVFNRIKGEYANEEKESNINTNGRNPVQ